MPANRYLLTCDVIPQLQSPKLVARCTFKLMCNLGGRELRAGESLTGNCMADRGVCR